MINQWLLELKMSTEQTSSTEVRKEFIFVLNYVASNQYLVLDLRFVHLVHE